MNPYRAEAWKDALIEYGSWIERLRIEREIEEALDEIESNIELFKKEVNLLGGNPDTAEFTIDCLYGWASHNYETDDGIMVWGARNPHQDSNYNPNLLEKELYAVSFKLYDGVYVGVSWRPQLPTA